MSLHDEQLESLLREADPAADLMRSSSDDLAERVRSRQTLIAKRRARGRRIGMATGCYVAGLLSMWVWMQSSGIREPGEVITQDASEWIGPIELIPDRDAQETDSLPNEIAIQPPSVDSPYEVLRVLGDRYLLEQGKVEQAVAIYGRALDQATGDESAVSYERDSWLLISMKRDRLISSL